MVENDKLRIGGIKYSGGIVQANLNYTASETDPGRLLFRLFTVQKINASMITHNTKGDEIYLSCCVSNNDRQKIEYPIEGYDTLKNRIWFREELGLLSIFPHKSRIHVLGYTLKAFSNVEIPVYAMATSISAITFVTRYQFMEKAVEALKSYFILPDHHTPFKPEFHVKQIQP
ncbi:hypothetical protein QUF76_06665 [Desulfobacterales bacterium HSG16]|nr:hypothetical protein [Desulfobacterales bacterium HSG16]